MSPAGTPSNAPSNDDGSPAEKPAMAVVARAAPLTTSPRSSREPFAAPFAAGTSVCAARSVRPMGALRGCVSAALC